MRTTSMQMGSAAYHVGLRKTSSILYPHLVHVHHVVEGPVRDVEVWDVGQEVVPHEDAHEHEVIDHALELKLERQLQRQRQQQQQQRSKKWGQAKEGGRSGAIVSLTRTTKTGFNCEMIVEMKGRLVENIVRVPQI